MDDATKAALKNTAGDYERIKNAVVRLPSAADMSADEFLDYMRKGALVLESEDGLLPVRYPERELMPLDPRIAPHWDIPAIARSGILENGFSVSADRCFDAVLKECAVKNGRGRRFKGAWYGPKLRRILRELRDRGHAHSLEIWKDNELVGGLFGVQIGGFFVSLSIFHKADSAGSAACAELHARLRRAGFLMHDAVLPSNVSRFFGGYLVARDEADLARRFAATRKMTFPMEPAILPAHEFPDQPQPQMKIDGRTFAL